MKNIVVIFAGGAGQRMNSGTRPKQFLELHGKPIIIYTLEQFERHPMIDGIVVVCLESWIPFCEELIARFRISKVSAVVPGGRTGLLSRYCGVKKAAELYPGDSVCLMHDGVRPLVDQDTITRNILAVREHGSAVTVAPAVETVSVREDADKVGTIIDRSRCQMCKAPQSFLLKDLLAVHEATVAAGIDDCIDTAYLMQQNGYELFTVEGSSENIKITTPTDYYIFRALVDVRENSQIFGI
ncbi:MAG: 2-C-methyl-D-erythritol 4-phosphate cytidylyltransferase [Oscillospiraceae bacterium]|nr:2-C-methyl-D-erythritol 4-phosphate cytidylyltransferase [Oscillospiraceae bacterium]